MVMMALLEAPSPSRSAQRAMAKLAPLLLLAGLPSTMAQNNQCISLRGSTACPAFNASSVSTSLRGQYPFLAFVSDVNSFDSQFNQYIATGYSQQKYQTLLGCSNVNLSNTTNIYARYTATFLCNALVQQSITPCGLSTANSRPMCADSCVSTVGSTDTSGKLIIGQAAFATSEANIASAPDTCGSSNSNAINLIRADFTTCALPSDSLTSNCISGAQNENQNCGFSNNLPSLCSYCAASSPNATDSCCLFSKTETRCQGVKLPFTTSIGNLFPTASSNSTSHGSGSGLSGGAIAGIVVGSILGAILLLAIIIGACIFLRRRKSHKDASIFNQPSPTRGIKGMSYNNASPTGAREPILPQGARVHQMTALEGTSSHGEHHSPSGGYLGSSSGYDDTPESQRSGLGAGGAPKRGGSLSRNSPGGILTDSSPNYGSSPEGMASGQSEQMSHFKDYYSSEDIHPGDTVATLWAYQPRAGDEWDLERGDMLKVVGIWDDGWATGYKLRDRAEDWESTINRNPNRDSGVSNGSLKKNTLSSPASGDASDGEIRAFPLVCVCLPDHWRKTIEGDGTDPREIGSTHEGSQKGSP